MPPVTICVLTYGDFFGLASRCIGSILDHCDRRSYDLIIGANQVGELTREYLDRLVLRGEIDRLYASQTNINKCPMMRNMFASVETEFLWWFDDDSYIVDGNALDLRLQVGRSATKQTVVWGHQFFFGHEADFSSGMDAVAFVLSATWYRGKSPPSWLPGGKGEFNFEERGVGDGRWFFITGGCWFARTAAMHALNWPDPRIVKRCDDVFLSEAVRQQGWAIQDIGPAGVVINAHPRRGNEL